MGHRTLTIKGYLILELVWTKSASQPGTLDATVSGCPYNPMPGNEAPLEEGL